MTKRSIIRLGFLFCFFVFYGKIEAQLSVNATLNTNEVLMGDEVEMTIFISYPSFIKMTGLQLDVLSPIDSLEIKSAPKADTASTDPYNVTQKLIFQSFDPGTYAIPPIPITYIDQGVEKQANTPPLQFEVRPYPVDIRDSVDIQPIKDIIGESIGVEEVMPWALGLVGIVLLVLLINWLANRGNREQFEPAPIETPPPPAHILAFEQLKVLKNAQLLSKGSFKEYQSRLTFILREYLENRYQINALESTTPEIIQDLKEKDFPDQWQTDLKAMLEKADLVKFAKAAFPNSFHEDAYKMVYSFVNSTRKIEREYIADQDAKEGTSTEQQDNKVTNG
ncbi:MAG: hypothetical protein AAF242_04680 [Bacteroidota bacterium]